MILAIEPIRAPRLGQTCEITPNDDEDGEHAGSTVAHMVVHVQLPIGTVEIDMCGSCLGDFIEGLQGGEVAVRVQLRNGHGRFNNEGELGG